MLNPFYKHQTLLAKAIFITLKEVPAAQDQPRDAEVQDGGREQQTIQVQGVRRGLDYQRPVHSQQQEEVWRRGTRTVNMSQ